MIRATRYYYLILAVLLFHTFIANGATYKRNVEVQYVKNSDVDIMIERVYWGGVEGDTETDQVLCQFARDRDDDLESIFLVFQTFDSQGKYLSAFSINASRSGWRRYDDSSSRDDECLTWDDEREKVLTLRTTFRRDRQIRSIQLVNVVLNNRDAIYSIRTMGQKITRSLSKPPRFENLKNAGFGNFDFCAKWNPEPKTGDLVKKHTLDDKRSKNVVITEESRAKGYGKAQIVHISSGFSKKLASCEAGDMVIIRYKSGVCGPSIEQRKSPDEATALIRPTIIRQIVQNGKKKNERMPINPDTQRSPQAFISNKDAVYGITLDKAAIGSVSYTYWVIPSIQVESFLKTPAGKSLVVEQPSMDITEEDDDFVGDKVLRNPEKGSSTKEKESAEELSFFDF